MFQRGFIPLILHFCHWLHFFKLRYIRLFLFIIKCHETIEFMFSLTLQWIYSQPFFFSLLTIIRQKKMQLGELLKQGLAHTLLSNNNYTVFMFNLLATSSQKEMNDLLNKRDIQYECMCADHLPKAYRFSFFSPEEMVPCRPKMSNVKDNPALTRNLIKHSFRISVKKQMSNWKPERSTNLSFPLSFF